jgi:hypothetical protein
MFTFFDHPNLRINIQRNITCGFRAFIHFETLIVLGFSLSSNSYLRRYKLSGAENVAKKMRWSGVFVNVRCQAKRRSAHDGGGWLAPWLSATDSVCMRPA